MSKRKANPRSHGLGSSDVEGQGTTTKEFDGKSVSSARRKKKKF